MEPTETVHGVSRSRVDQKMEESIFSQVTLIKEVLDLLEEGSVAEAQELLRTIFSGFSSKQPKEARVPFFD